MPLNSPDTHEVLLPHSLPTADVLQIAATDPTLIKKYLNELASDPEESKARHDLIWAMVLLTLGVNTQEQMDH